MLQELAKSINKEVNITLTNGKEKQGTVVSVDIESSTIRLRDNNNSSIPILISMIGMVEPLESNKYEQLCLSKESIESNNSNQPSVSKEEISNDSKTYKQSTNDYKTIERIIKIETTFDTEIKDCKLTISAPDLTVPEDIKNIGYKSNELEEWNRVKNKYSYAVKVGRLTPNSDDLRDIIYRTKTLLENPKLSNSLSIHRHLSYFHYVNNNKTEAIKFYQQTAKLSKMPQDWFNLAVIAIEKDEIEIAYYALKQVFLKTPCTELKYEKAWYKFVDLTIHFSVYSSFNEYLNSPVFFTTDELKKLFEAICYCLLKNGQKQIAETQIQASFTNQDYKKLALEGLKLLPQEPLPSYVSLKADFEKVVRKVVVQPVVNTQSSKTPLDRNNSYPKVKYVDFLREARNARDFTKDFPKAEKLFIEGIEKENFLPTKQRAVRDLASMLAQQMSEPKRAIEVIEKYQTSLSESDWNLLFNFNYQLGDYDTAIKIQSDLLKNTTKRDQKVAKYTLIASCYLRLTNYREAENNYKNALKINPANSTVKRNIALCLYQQGKIEDAKKLLNELILEFGDANSIQLLDKIEGRDLSPIEDLFDAAGLIFENLDEFTNYYISSCDFTYVDKSRLSDDGTYIGSEENKRFDINKLVETASTLKSRIPVERSNIYLNAARILFDLGEQGNDFYKFLCRSFASKGDNAVQSRNSVDTVKTYYLTSLKVYDALYLDDERTQRRDEQDAINALCRYLFSCLGRDKIPLIAGGDKNLSIRETINSVFLQHSDPNKLFESLKLIFARSPQYAMDHVLQILLTENELKKSACVYLNISEKSTNDLFFENWKNEVREINKIESELSIELRILRKFQLSEITLTTNKDRIATLLGKVLFDLDKDYLQELQSIFDLCITLCKLDSVDEKNNKCEDIEQRTNTLINKIENNPTKLSIEDIYPITTNILSALKAYLNDLHLKSKPELVFSSVFPSYQVKKNKHIDLQVKIENRAEGHAEQVELCIELSEEYFEAANSLNISYGTIRGKNRESKIIDIQLTEKAIKARAFSIRVWAKFSTRQNENYETTRFNLPVQLGQEKDFVEIKPNPYANGASGRPVQTDEMFKGRENYIQHAYQTMVEDGVSYVIYGQYRSGKSSILQHLEKKLEDNPKIVVAKLGDAGKFMGDSESAIPLFYRFLHRILLTLKEGIKKKTKVGLSELDFNVPDSKTFYEHPSPADYFYEILDNFQSQKIASEDWEDIRVIVSIDEFSYIYGKIVEGKLSDDFMESWKALLATNYFNVVLVAQDVFPKFFAKYENAFGTIFPQRITYLDGKSAEDLIDEPIKRLNNGESKFRENAIEKIIELTAGHPWYIQIFCDALVKYINKDKQMYITGANVDIVKERLLSGTDRKDNFKNFIENGDPSPDAISHKDIIRVLKKIAEHTKNNVYCSRNSINCLTETDINEILKDLEGRGVIAAHGEKGYQIRVGLFKEWLNENPNVWE